MRRIFIDADKCDGCKNCSVACMDAHRSDGLSDIYTLCLTDPARDVILFCALPTANISLYSAGTVMSLCVREAV